MTERGHGAPDPAEPSSSGDARTPADPTPGTVPPADLGEVRRTDAIIDALAARRAAGSASRLPPGGETGRRLPPEESDPAVRLLRALIDDVDDPGPGAEGGPETTPPTPPAPGPETDPGSGPGPRRRGPRTIVALGVAGAVLASTGVAAAGGVTGEHPPAAAPGPATGEPGGARTTVRADTDAGTYHRPRTPARPAPEPERPSPTPTPAPKTTPSTGPGAGDEPRVFHPFPFMPRSPRPDGPSTSRHGFRPPAAESPDDASSKSPSGVREPTKRYPDGHDRDPRHRYRDRD